jgi:hypothetical protein
MFRFLSPAVPHPHGFAARLTEQPWAHAPWRALLKQRTTG